MTEGSQVEKPDLEKTNGKSMYNSLANFLPTLGSCKIELLFHSSSVGELSLSSSVFLVLNLDFLARKSSFEGGAGLSAIVGANNAGSSLCMHRILAFRTGMYSYCFLTLTTLAYIPLFGLLIVLSCDYHFTSFCSSSFLRLMKILIYGCQLFSNLLCSITVSEKTKIKCCDISYWKIKDCNEYQTNCQ